MTICAVITDADSASARGFTVSGRVPVLDLCLALLEAGHDPAERLEASRGTTLCITVRSIGEGARLTVRDNKRGSPRLRRKTEAGIAGALPVRLDEEVTTPIARAAL
jgi:hypothetical protein